MKGSGEQVRRIGFNVASLRYSGGFSGTSLRPGVVDLLPPVCCTIPDLLRHDPKPLVVAHVPFAFGFWKLPLPARLRVTPCLRPVPDPSADVLFVLQDPAYRGWGPPAPELPAPLDLLDVEFPRKRFDCLAPTEIAEDSEHHLGLGGINNHPIAFGSRAAPPVDPYL